MSKRKEEESVWAGGGFWGDNFPFDTLAPLASEMKNESTIIFFFTP